MSKNQRRDAVRVKGLDSFHTIIPYMMPKRTEAEVSMTESFDVTELNTYLKSRNAAEGTNLKLFHALCTGIARTVYHRPKLNYFIAGRRYWQRRDITLSFVAKRRFNDEAEESLVFMKVKPDMTLDTVSHIVLGDVDKARHEGKSDVDQTLDAVAKMPRILLELLFGVLRRLEYHGIMPAGITRGDPNYSTVLLSNLGSIGCGAPYHHLSNYGTCSMMVTIGTMHPVLKPDGSVRDMVDLTLTLDERIADGFYFARSLRLLHYMLEHPAALEEPIEVALPVEV